jgi:hypothetical protein
MGALLAALTATAVLLQQQPDTTSPYADAATRTVVAKAMARQHVLDSAVTDYEARIRYRLTLSLGRRRWGISPPAAVEEQDARVQWRAPNDVRVDVLGRRQVSASKDLTLQSVWDRPWFVPRSLGDSVTIFSDEFPAIAPLHPFAHAGPEWYRYALVDSLAISLPGGKRIRVYEIDVVPSRKGEALLTGRLWVDAATSEVVRFAFRYTGTSLWVAPDDTTRSDSTDARRANSLINRFFSLDVDLEYALQGGQYWLPYRQVISGRFSVPLMSDLVIPFEAVTTFRDFEINTGRAPQFSLALPAAISRDSARRLWQARQDSLTKARRAGTGEIPDSLWAGDYGGRWNGGQFEIHRPPRDSLRQYAEWGDSLQLEGSPEDAARLREIEGELEGLAEGLPDSITGRRRVTLAVDRPTDLIGFNRVQGWSFGGAVGIRLPKVKFTTLYPSARYGLADGRLLYRLGVVRNGPGWKLGVAGYRDIVDQDPVSPGRTVPNAFNAVVTTHDNADYMEVYGGNAVLTLAAGFRSELRLTGRVESQRSIGTQAFSNFNDLVGGQGTFQANAPVTEGTFVGLGATLTGGDAWRWSVTADGLSGAGTTTGRVFGELRHVFGDRPAVAVRLKAGATTADPLPQMAFRAGGQQTVRSTTYGTLRGETFWAALVDVTPWTGTFRPVLFADAGWAGAYEDFGRQQPLIGGGVGLSIYSDLLRSGLIRFDLSHQFYPSEPVIRFNVIVQAFR